MSKALYNPFAITAEEMRKLRSLKIKKTEIHFHSVGELVEWLAIPKARAMELYALSEFQSVPSVGIRFAQDLIAMGYYSLQDLKGKDGTKLLHQFETGIGAWVDPCVEDCFRHITHYATHRDDKLKWWDFTAERKAYRAAHGYPANRPSKPWYELPQRSTDKRIDAARPDTQKDLHRKLAGVVSFMKKNSDKRTSIAELAALANLSQYHFIRCFKSAYEVTPQQYLTRLRLKKASLMLKRSQAPIADIAWECAFENESAFSRLFRKEFSMTPTAYRSRARANL